MKATQLMVGSLLFLIVSLIQVGFCDELEDRYARLSYESGLVLGYSRGISALSSNLCRLESPISSRGGKADSGSGSLASTDAVREKFKFFKEILESHESRLTEIRDLTHTPFVHDELERARVTLFDLVQMRSSQKSCQSLSSVLLILGDLQIRMSEEQDRLRMELQLRKKSLVGRVSPELGVSSKTSSLERKVRRAEMVDEAVQVSERSLPRILPEPVKSEGRVTGLQLAPQNVPIVAPQEVKREAKDRVDEQEFVIDIMDLSQLPLSEKKKGELQEVLYDSAHRAMKKILSDYNSGRPARRAPLISLSVRVQRVEPRVNCFGKSEGYTADLFVKGEVDLGRRRGVESFRVLSTLSYESKRWYKTQKSVGFTTELTSQLILEIQRVIQGV